MIILRDAIGTAVYTNPNHIVWFCRIEKLTRVTLSTGLEIEVKESPDLIMSLIESHRQNV